MERQRDYYAELNRPHGDNIRRAARRLARWGLEAYVQSHKTTLRIVRPDGMSWAQFKNALLAAIHPRRGSMLLFSQRSGKVFNCSNAGNQPGIFQRL